MAPRANGDQSEGRSCNKKSGPINNDNNKELPPPPPPAITTANKSTLLDARQQQVKSINQSNLIMQSSKKTVGKNGNTKQQELQLAASLRSAAQEGKVELVRLLLKCGADVNAQDEEVSQFRSS